MNTRAKLALAGLIVGMGLVSLFIFGGLINSYKEWRFQQKEAVYEQKIKEGFERDKQYQEAIKAKDEQIKAIDEQVTTLQTENADLTKQVEQKRQTFVTTRRSFTPRPVGNGSTDAELRRDAEAAGLTIRTPN